MQRVYQEAPWPFLLEALVNGIRYKPGWTFSLEEADRGHGCVGTTLAIRVSMQDTYNPSRPLTPCHTFAVPAAAMNVVGWRRWLFDRIMDVELHEAMEFFQFGEERPYAPVHDLHDRYTIYESGTLEP